LTLKVFGLLELGFSLTGSGSAAGGKLNLFFFTFTPPNLFTLFTTFSGVFGLGLAGGGPPNVLGSGGGRRTGEGAGRSAGLGGGGVDLGLGLGGGEDFATWGRAGTGRTLAVVLAPPKLNLEAKGLGLGLG